MSFIMLACSGVIPLCVYVALYYDINEAARGQKC